MYRYLIINLICVLILLGSTAAWAQTIHNIRYGAQENQTRIVLDMSRQSGYSIDALASPPRIVLDFPQNFTAPQTLMADPTGRISGVRYGMREDGGKRVVFDLNAPVRINNHFYIAPSNANPNFRLVLDVEPGPIAVPAPPTAEIPEAVTAFENTLNIDALLPLPSAKPWPDKPISKYKIVIDAGHGGGDPGSIGHNHVQEKDIVLKIAQKLKDDLERSGRYEVYMTRSSDYYIQLRERFQKARSLNADLFISLHADKLHIPSVRGVSVYTLSETASDKETARLAQQENNAGIVAGVDLGVEEEDVASILLDLVRRETLNESKLFAELFVQDVKSNNITFLKNPHRYAGFAVLKAPDVPSVLIETGFLSNRDDSELLQKPSFQIELAQVIHSSINKFFDRLERFNSE